MKPQVSVTMAVHDAERYLGAALESIERQSFPDFELIAVDDGSRDGSLAILQRHAARDPRLRVIARPHSGIAVTRNAALAAAQADLVAVMDADDVAHPERLARQVAHLRSHPEIVALGAGALIIDPEGWPIRRLEAPLEHAAIDAALMRGRGEALVHPSVVFRRDSLLAASGYREGIDSVEDLDLCLRLAERGRLANLPETLLEYRHHLRKSTYALGSEHRRLANRVLRDAQLRRGLDAASGYQMPALAGETPAVDYRCEWVRQAVIGGNLATARKHALAVLREQPGRARSWQLLARALFGLRSEPLRRWLGRPGAAANPVGR
ncbi:MAG: glycosyltransferase family 2 protein [Candidatus Limnocylindria bacterium]|jgi:glycosyltransferase involved in cell wall biosynthesis